MSSATPTDLILRPATVDDAAALAAVHVASRSAAVAAGTMPPSIHADHKAHGWVSGGIATAEVWVAELDDDVVAYLRLTEDWLDDLYVAPGAAGQGIGAALLEIAKVCRPQGFGLWVFEINEPARRFYAERGLREVERTDGRDNEERAPDIRVVWAP